MLQQHLFIDGHQLPTLARSNCSRPYYYQRIPHSNLLLVVVDASFSTCHTHVSAQPTKMEYDEEFPCYKLSLNDLPRRRLDECFTEHPEVSGDGEKFAGQLIHSCLLDCLFDPAQEANVTYCGLGTSAQLTAAAVFWSLVYTVTLRLAR